MTYSTYRKLGFTTLQNGLIAYYSRIGLSDAEFVVIIELEAFSQRGEEFPSNEQLAANTNLTAGEAGQLIQQMIDKDLIAIEQINDQQGRIGNRYSLDGLYQKLDEFLKSQLPKASQAEPTEQILDNNPLTQLTREFEMEFGRYLSPIEREEIQSWLTVDHYDVKIIELALREAVLAQAYSLKYVDRILLNWQRHNLKTTTEVKQFLRRNR